MPIPGFRRRKPRATQPQRKAGAEVEPLAGASAAPVPPTERQQPTQPRETIPAKPSRAPIELPPGFEHIEEPRELDNVILVTAGVLVGELAARFQIMHVRGEAIREAKATLEYVRDAREDAVTGPKPHREGTPVAEGERILTTEASYAGLEYAYGLQDDIVRRYSRRGPEGTAQGEALLDKAAALVEATREDAELSRAVIELATKGWHLLGESELQQTAQMLTRTKLTDTIKLFQARDDKEVGERLDNEEYEAARRGLLESIPGTLATGLKLIAPIVPWGKTIEHGIEAAIKPLSENEDYVLGKLHAAFPGIQSTTTMGEVVQGLRTLATLKGIEVSDADLPEFVNAIAAQVLIAHEQSLLLTEDHQRTVPAELAELLPIAELSGLLDVRQPGSTSVINKQSDVLHAAARR